MAVESDSSSAVVPAAVATDSTKLSTSNEWNLPPRASASIAGDRPRAAAVGVLQPGLFSENRAGQKKKFLQCMLTTGELRNQNALLQRIGDCRAPTVSAQPYGGSPKKEILLTPPLWTCTETEEDNLLEELQAMEAAPADAWAHASADSDLETIHSPEHHPHILSTSSGSGVSQWQLVSRDRSFSLQPFFGYPKKKRSVAPTDDEASAADVEASEEGLGPVASVEGPIAVDVCGSRRAETVGSEEGKEPSNKRRRQQGEDAAAGSPCSGATADW